MFLKRLKKVVMGITLLSLFTSLLFPTFGLGATAGSEDADTTTPLGELVAHWTFDGNYNESVNGMTTELGAKQLTYVDGIYGKAAVFNGKDTYLTVKNSILNLGNSRDKDNNNFTISAWVNLGDSKEGDKYLLDKGEDSFWDSDGNYYANPYSIHFYGCEPYAYLSNVHVDSESGLETTGYSTTNGKWVEGQEWFLLTVTYDGTRVKVYHDNELLNQSNYTDGISFNNEALYIGVNGKLENYFKGAVDDLRIYTKTLSYNEVVDLYAQGLKANKELVEPTKQLVAYYAFDDNTKDSSSFKNDAEKVAASGTIKYVVGKNGKAITMTKGSYIRIPAADQLNFNTEFTISFWLKLDKDGSFPILYRQNPSFVDNNDDDWTYMLSIDSWNKGVESSILLRTRAFTPDDWAPLEGQGLNTGLTYEDHQIKSTNWVNYYYTYKDGQMKCYVNGKLQNKTDKSDYIDISNASGDLLIGYDGETFLSGSIDELRIYNSTTSADDAVNEAKRIDSISLSKQDAKAIASISKGKSVTLTSILLKDIDANKTIQIKTTDKEIIYKTSNKAVFTVSSTGKITTLKAGKGKLTITYGGHSVTYNVTVK